MLSYNPELMEFAVETRGLSRTFGSKRAVDGIDLQVPAGSFYGFLGPNGAGKSTTIKCLTGLLRPSGGEHAHPRDRSARRSRRDQAPRRRRPRGSRAVRSADGGGNAELRRAGARHAAPRRSRRGPTDLLSLMDLTGAATTLVTDFSHGMRKKLSLAAALLPAPRLLFLDEPFEGIDAVASRQIKDLLHSFVARGGTVFLTSHILEIVERLSTHIGVIADGRHRRAGPHRGGAGRGARHRARSRSSSSSWSAASGPPRTSTGCRTMGRIFRAFLWMRWRVLVNSLERTGSRDTLERFSIAADKLGPDHGDGPAHPLGHRASSCSGSPRGSARPPVDGSMPMEVIRYLPASGARAHAHRPDRAADARQRQRRRGCCCCRFRASALYIGADGGRDRRSVDRARRAGSASGVAIGLAVGPEVRGARSIALVAGRGVPAAS